MKFKIDDEVLEKFPNVQIGILTVTGIDNTGTNSEILNLIKQEQERIQKAYEKETLSENERIKCWREAFSLFGAKPKKYRCSVENLYKMTLDGIGLEHINKIVDLYNYLSLKHMVPVGGDDLDNVEGDIVLKIAKGDERFVELNSDELKNPKEGEVVYSDDKEILCRRWNWRECNKSKMQETTKTVSLVVEGLVLSKEEINTIINELQGLVVKYLGGETKTFILNKENKEVEL